MRLEDIFAEHQHEGYQRRNHLELNIVVVVDHLGTLGEAPQDGPVSPVAQVVRTSAEVERDGIHQAVAVARSAAADGDVVAEVELETVLQAKLVITVKSAFAHTEAEQHLKS